MDDIQAIRCLKRGNLSGLEALMSRYQGKAARAAFLVLGDPSLAQDVVQETFIRIVDRIESFNETLRFEPYLIRSVINASLNTVRDDRKLMSLDDETNEIENLLDQAGSIESQVEFAELQQKIMDALSRLPARQRAAIVQRYYMDMSEKEMAITLEAAPGTVKWLLSAARERLRSLLGQEGGFHE
jgi:RNA polymerase sigma-70 factor, ECF subfamily